jgi:hypothetical protein
MTEAGLRHVFLKVGPTTVLRTCQLLEGTWAAAFADVSRGRLDHFAPRAPSEEGLGELRRRVEAEGAADGDMRDMKSHWITATSADSAAHQRMLERPGYRDSDLLERRRGLR